MTRTGYQRQEFVGSGQFFRQHGPVEAAKLEEETNLHSVACETSLQVLPPGWRPMYST